MKCPKCNYLDLKSVDRCNNCGYDFSLMVTDRGFSSSNRQSSSKANLPLFNDSSLEDSPLVSVPVKPRTPISVRRTPDINRDRNDRRQPEESLFDFSKEPTGKDVQQSPSQAVVSESSIVFKDQLTESVTTRRLSALVLDHVILIGIDVVVLYLTVRIAGFQFNEVGLLPPLPLVFFLGLLKMSYFSVFTASGGQTIGKMAFRIRVVSQEMVAVDSASALRRTTASVLTLFTLGLAYIPVLLGSAGRRSLHDYLAKTRVVSVPRV
jgi:uncharacterized RDD family membrane protein YckC